MDADAAQCSCVFRGLCMAVGLGKTTKDVLVLKERLITDSWGSKWDMTVQLRLAQRETRLLFSQHVTTCTKMVMNSCGSRIVMRLYKVHNI